MQPHTETIQETLVAAVFLGIAAQVFAHRYRLPAILPLLLLGMFAGPAGLHLFEPHALGDTLEVIVHLGVAVILFEGGLTLVPEQLRQVSTPLRNLLTVGTAVTAVGAAWLAQTITGISWQTAALFGAIVTVTGPTVIGPLLRVMVAPKRVRTLLISEGLMIDAIGAVLAYFVLQWIERSGLGWRTLCMDLLTLTLSGVILGFVAGSLAIMAVRHRHLGAELRNLVILALLFGSFLVAERQAPQSGILAAVVMGLRVSAADIPDLSPLRAFKGQLTVLVISVLFILLSGNLDLSSMADLGWRGLLVVAGLLFIVRPLSVFASIPPSAMSVRERLLLGLTAPRGIVAAAVASLAAIELRSAGAMEDAAALEGLVYLVILVSCTVSTIFAGTLPRLLGFTDDPSRRRVVMVGANSLSQALAENMAINGWNPLIIDGSHRKVRDLRSQDIMAVSGDARDTVTYDHAGVERDTRVLALTFNDELNLLIADLMHDQFDIEHPSIVLQGPPSDLGTQRQSWLDILGERQIQLPVWCRRLDDGDARLIDFEITEGKSEALQQLLREQELEIIRLCAWRGDVPEFHLPFEQRLDVFDRITLLVGRSAWDDLEALQSGTGEAKVEGNGTAPQAEASDEEKPEAAGAPA